MTCSGMQLVCGSLARTLSMPSRTWLSVICGRTPSHLSLTCTQCCSGRLIQGITYWPVPLAWVCDMLEAFILSNISCANCSHPCLWSLVPKKSLADPAALAVAVRRSEQGLVQVSHRHSCAVSPQALPHCAGMSLPWHTHHRQQSSPSCMHAVCVHAKHGVDGTWPGQLSGALPPWVMHAMHVGICTDLHQPRHSLPQPPATSGPVLLQILSQARQLGTGSEEAMQLLANHGLMRTCEQVGSRRPAERLCSA